MRKIDYTEDQEPSGESTDAHSTSTQTVVSVAKKPSTIVMVVVVVAAILAAYFLKG